MLGFFSGGNPSVGELLIIVVLVLLLFGAKRLPELARSLGKSITEFKKGRREPLDEMNENREEGR